MKFEMNHNVGTDYSTVKFKTMLPDCSNAAISLLMSFHRLGGNCVPNLEQESFVWKFPAFITSQVLEEVIRNTCFVCGGLIGDGIAIQNGKVLVSSYDSVADTYQGEIEYPNLKDSKVIKVRKCSSCGHSHT